MPDAALNETSYVEFKRKILKKSGIDLSSYKQQQMQRRINALMETLGVKTYEEYFRLLEENQQRYQEFLKRLTINVTEFMRNPERFGELETEILPALLAKSGKLKIWSAGCAIGAEPYSLAILLQDLDPKGSRQGNHRILATDVDRQVLEKARQGIYATSELRNLSPARLAKYFTKVGPDSYQVTEDLKKLVDFRQHNLLTDSFENDFDLILCRNVVIYFTEDAKDKLYHRFYDALKTGGVFLVGGTEPLLRYRDFGFECLFSTFYRK
ncbi:MAG: protein-glutamate O-methyltransferase CheR [Firmicutes bacterium]|nr:protein-glutamate O-methyltransferase CheR [Bacillota bacterium]